MSDIATAPKSRDGEEIDVIGTLQWVTSSLCGARFSLERISDTIMHISEVTGRLEQQEYRRAIERMKRERSLSSYVSETDLSPLSPLPECPDTECHRPAVRRKTSAPSRSSQASTVVIDDPIVIQEDPVIIE